MLRALALAALCVPLSACHWFRQEAQPVYVVDGKPPPVRHRRMAPRQGQIWARGHYEWRGGNWHWKSGSWVAERPGFRFRPGRWEPCGARYCFREAAWERESRGP